MKIITVSREFGSGGRELGKRLSDCLGWPYYDREIISAVARRNALDEGYVEDALEQGDFRGVPLTIGRTFAYLPSMPHDSRQLLQEQRRVLRALAAHGDCIIVGRNADLILAEHRPLKLFVYPESWSGSSGRWTSTGPGTTPCSPTCPGGDGRGITCA